MPSLTLPPAPSLPSCTAYQNRLLLTLDPVDYIDLPIIDLAKFENAEDRALLATQVQDALLTHGFFYVTDRMFDIADIPFAGVSDEEKQAYAGTMKQDWIVPRIQTSTLLVNRDVTKRGHPEVLRQFLPEIKEFTKFNHFNVPASNPAVSHRLIAMSLELPEDALVNVHNYDAIGETYVALRSSSYPRSSEEEAKTNNVWLKGHTDFGSITMLWSQPVAALQILSKDGRWRWVKHIDNALVVNAGDALDFLTGGYYKGTIHRVVQPPPDQQQYARLGVFYFVMPD
ncbi:hypothetical protein J3R83DRAFT_13692 [Lanmaoa asiatica]|nr:hypothetical protein J3R83DRAFT_13692 [Lanmaoa asiatica]